MRARMPGIQELVPSPACYAQVMEADEKQLREVMARVFGIAPEEVDLTGLEEAAEADRRFAGDVDAERVDVAKRAPKSAAG